MTQVLKQKLLLIILNEYNYKCVMLSRAHITRVNLSPVGGHEYG